MLRNNCNERDGMNLGYATASGGCAMNYPSTPTSSCGCGGPRTCPMPCCPPNQSCCCPPVCECPQNQVCHRMINYEVPHICPMNTTVVNHHIYNHTYTPSYSYNEVDEVENIYNRCH